MNEGTNNQTLARRYLLGVLSDDEAARLEESYFLDDNLYEEIEAAEDELVDAYVRGQLSEEDRERFENELATSKRLSERVHFSKSLMAVPVASSQTRVPWWNFLATFLNGESALKTAVAAGVLIVVLGTPFLFVEWVRLRYEFQRVAAERSELERKQQDLEQQIAGLKSNADQLAAKVQEETAANEKLKQQVQSLLERLAQPRTQLGLSHVVSAVLVSNLSRSRTDDTGLVVYPQHTVIKLDLVLDLDEYSTYTISIQSADGRELVSRKRQQAHGPASQRTLSVEFSSRILPEGTYVVKVTGRTSSGSYEPVSGYRFRLSRR